VPALSIDRGRGKHVRGSLTHRTRSQCCSLVRAVLDEVTTHIHLLGQRLESRLGAQRVPHWAHRQLICGAFVSAPRSPAYSVLQRGRQEPNRRRRSFQVKHKYVRQVCAARAVTVEPTQPCRTQRHHRQVFHVRSDPSDESPGRAFRAGNTASSFAASDSHRPNLPLTSMIGTWVARARCFRRARPSLQYPGTDERPLFSVERVSYR
jgi:hypothetical protein